MSIVDEIEDIPDEYRRFKGLRPFVHVIIIFAHSNEEVNDYGKKIVRLFLDNGIDVYKEDEYTPGTEIRISHLSSIINHSRGDFIVTVGDKNLKNGTIQARKRGKLVEIGLAEFVYEVWNEMKKRARGDIMVRDSANIADSMVVSYIEEIEVRLLSERTSLLEHSMKLLRILRDEKGMEDKMDYVARIESTMSLIIELIECLFAADTKLKQMSHFVEVETENGIEYGGGYLPHEIRKSHCTAFVKMRAIDLIARKIEQFRRYGDEVSSLGNPKWLAYKQTGISTEAVHYPRHAEPFSPPNRILYSEHEEQIRRQNEEMGEKNQARRHSLPILQYPIVPGPQLAVARPYQMYPQQIHYNPSHGASLEYTEKRRGSSPNLIKVNRARQSYFPRVPSTNINRAGSAESISDDLLRIKSDLSELQRRNRSLSAGDTGSGTAAEIEEEYKIAMERRNRDDVKDDKYYLPSGI